MKIRKLQLKNIGVFDDVEIKFEPCPEGKAEIHIFTGQNGTGKTTILQALASAFNPYLTVTKTTGFIRPSKERDINFFSKKFRDNSDLDSITANSFLLVDCENNSANVPNPKTVIYPNTQTKELTVHDEMGSLSSYRNYLMGYAGEITFAVFAFSGYRQIESETVQANYLPKNFNPLSQSLDFVKNYQKEDEITINQLIANNISNRALSKEDGSFEESKKYEAVIKAIETFIRNVTDYEVKFILKRSPNELKLKMHGEELDFDVLPDGLRSLISWIADLLGRVDLLKWQDDLPINEKNLILLLDEIEVHLHPAWQRKVLPVVQKLFKNSQIFVSTHSPFVVNSVDDAWVYKLELDGGKARVASVERSEDARSYRYVLRNTFDIENEFGIEIEKRLKDFYELRDKVLAANGSSQKAKTELKKIAGELSKQSKELKSKIDFELFQLSEITGEDF